MKQHFTSALSQTFGRFASKEHRKRFQTAINHAYVKAMGLDMSDFELPETYPSLNALFTRKFRHKRSFSHDPLDMISPCDSLITECGTIEDDLALQIKGMRYSIDGVLGDWISPESKKSVYNGTFVNFYLSPRDYHRYHAPIDMQVLRTVHIPGKLYPVNIPSLKKQVNLFIENERVVLECLSSDGKRFFLILVGALNVGEMEVSFEPRIRTNGVLTPSQYSYKDLYLSKGDDFGCFRMGSTIVMLCEKEMLELGISTGHNVRFAQTIARINASK
ncbi:MAG: phosphatidylserine decarboxylase [Sulfuricurvum sp.]|uniref:phosphatidylserine decarboxylase n=1 Tax=Sulfuricurvum sp. TaxID=2025608 RepID=UPI00263979F0|nr:phosphatidylserine decarboxylase [Sulfuricurvum sp.]MDD5158636.1 phosphatidylserine decarboxylase [Sulfuricurvum sp.]MDD5160298.1 phosphatidylserine decarboxylase [Sulfuricurvum sp.]